MECESTEFSLPPAPRGLCFDRNDFVKTNFSVDNFLAEHQDVASLETMRDDLGMYLKVLRLAMIELINKDYANFVNLCATLIGFDKAIAKVHVPLEQLNKDVLNVKQSLEDAMKETSMWMSQRHNLQSKKQLLKYYSQTINSLNTLDNVLQNITEQKMYDKIVLADRAAMQYNQLKFTIKKCDNLVKLEHKTQFTYIEETLVRTLNELLFQFWNDGDEENLTKALLTLATLDRVGDVEKLLRKQAVAPLLQDIINESALQRNKDGLSGIYDLVLALLDTKFKLLLSITQHSKLAFLDKKYRFLVNSFWCEVENRIEINLSSIFAPGNPQTFFKRYNESMEFIKKFEQYCLAENTVKLFRETIEYKSFKRRWNLPVYFQIRFQEIAGSYEGSLHNDPFIESSDGFILKQTYKCWLALQDCWSDGIYIKALGHKFWKLSLQLISRYASWASSYCSQKASLRKAETLNVNKKLINNSINIYVDIHNLVERLPSLLQLVESKLEIENNELLRNSLQSSKESLRAVHKRIKEFIINELYDNFNVQLKQVSDIPRLYRKTNRSVPSKPCAYIDTVSNALREFNEDASKRLDQSFLSELYEDLFSVLTVSYHRNVEDVLTSVQKTEDSLRRLKQIREVASHQNPEIGITDGDKIRLQLKVDVISYGKIAESLKLDVHSVQKYTDLSNMVTDAVKNIEIK